MLISSMPTEGKLVDYLHSISGNNGPTCNAQTESLLCLFVTHCKGQLPSFTQRKKQPSQLPVGINTMRKCNSKKCKRQRKGRALFVSRYEEGERCEREKRNQEVVKHIHLKMPRFGSCKTLPVIQGIRQDQSRRRLRAHLHSVLHQARWRVTNEGRVLVKQQHAVTGLIDQ
ncbi:hypothetical protein BJX62DRAFT_121492 [Aspergillus germanicus]